MAQDTIAARTCAADERPRVLTVISSRAVSFYATDVDHGKN
jgi:hypothetical protein